MNPSDNIGLTDFLVIVFKFLKRNFILISITTLIGLVIGIAYVSQKPDYYSTELIGFSPVVHKTTLLEIMSPITILAEEKNYEELSSKLNLSIDEASQIRSIQFLDSKHTKTSHAPSVTDNKLGNLILVKALVYDKTVLENLEKGIYFFTNNNSYTKNRETLERQKMETMISEISKNIAMIDSLNVAKANESGRSSVTIQGEINPSSYKDAISTIETLKVKAKLLEPFTIVSGFYKLKKPANNNTVIVLSSTIAFFIISLLIVFVKELSELAKE